MRKGANAMLSSSLCVLCLLVAGPSPVTFTDVTKSAGIDFVSVSPPDKKYIVESMNGGVAFFDFDNDGLLDIYLINSYSVADALARKPRPHAALYRNLGNGKFVDVALKAGVVDPGWAMGVSVADYDNDGFDDLFITCFGPNRLYHNRGDGTFEDVTARAGVGDARFSTGAAWGDYDRDGYLDLFVASYVDFKLSDLPQFGKGIFASSRRCLCSADHAGSPAQGTSSTTIMAMAHSRRSQRRPVSMIRTATMAWSDVDRL
jgi:hypothetical protein